MAKFRRTTVPGGKTNASGEDGLASGNHTESRSSLNWKQCDGNGFFTSARKTPHSPRCSASCEDVDDAGLIRHPSEAVGCSGDAASGPRGHRVACSFALLGCGRTRLTALAPRHRTLLARSRNPRAHTNFHSRLNGSNCTEPLGAGRPSITTLTQATCPMPLHGSARRQRSASAP